MCVKPLTCERDTGGQAEQRGLLGRLCVCTSAGDAGLTLDGQRVTLQLTERNGVCARRKRGACRGRGGCAQRG